MSLKLILLVALAFSLFRAQKEILIDYEDFKNFADSQMKYFYDVEDGYFLQIGGFDPIIISLSHPLITQGWNGITVEANPFTSKSFYEQRIGQQNVNAAAGVSDEMVTLYVNTRPGRSTISKEVKDDGGSPNAKFTSEAIVPGLSLKQICERYFLKKVNFFTLDVQGFGGQVLKSNDWSNPLCVPQFIIIEDNRLNKVAGTQSLEPIFTQHGYVSIDRARTNVIYVLKEMKEYFQEKGRKGIEWIKARQHVHWEEIMTAISKVEKFQGKRRYQARNSPYYLHFSNTGPLHLEEVSQRSNMLGEYQNKTDRPIYIFHYNPSKSRIYIEDPNFTIQKVNIGRFEFYNIKMQNERKKQINVYILNHFYEPRIQITKSSIKYSVADESNSNPNQLVIDKITQLSNSESIKNITIIFLILLVAFLIHKLASTTREQKNQKNHGDDFARLNKEESENI